MKQSGCLLCILCIALSTALRLQPCDSAGYVEVVENEAVTLTCDQYSETVAWTVDDYTVGQCDASSCDVPVFNRYTLTYINASSSTFTSTATSRAVGDATFQCASSAQNTRSCALHIVVPAVIGTPSITVTTPSSGNGWSISGDVTISQVYSSRDLYTCNWSMKLNNGQYSQVVIKSPTFDPATDPTADRSGHCDFTNQPLPSNSGTYTYRVMISPGPTSATDNSLVIAAPPQPTRTCGSTGYVSEDANVSCTCNGSVGQPAGRLMWFKDNAPVKLGTYGDVSLMLTLAVNRSDDGDVLRCDVDWVTRTEGSAYTVRVAYGPDSVIIPQSPVFYTDSSGSRDLTLTCEPRDVSPTTDLTYSWTTPCADVTTDTCSFRPRPPGGTGGNDVNALIRCTVTNPRANRYRTGDFRLQLKYPPHEAPQITGYTSTTILYEGDPLTLTCTVAGGDPAIASVTLTCGGNYHNTSTSQQSMLQVTSLQSSDQGALCSCSGQWIKPNHYNLTDNVTFTVFSPPSSPIIIRTDGSTRPPVEGDNMTLTCTVTSSGHPEVNLTWTGQRTGTISRPDTTSSTLRMTSLQRSDNSKVIRCRASNAFTVYKQQTLEDTETLHVYYGPYINIAKSDDDGCLLTSDTCTIKEGQRLHLRCDVDSNPSAQGCVWHSYTTDNSGTSAVITLDISTVLDISSVNRSQGGVYHVTAETTKPDVTDTRLPLATQFNLKVLVQYPPTNTTLSVAGSKTLTVNEGQTVTFDCQSRGRPSPRLTLGRRSKDVVLSQQDGGMTGQVEGNTHLTFTFTARCSNTDTYTCAADNHLGSTQDVITLFVKCAPEQAEAPPGDIAVISLTQRVATFTVVAFPTPTISSVLRRLPDGSFSDELVDISFTTQCQRTSIVTLDVICNVTMIGMTSTSAAGMYFATVMNSLGSMEVEFRVEFGEPTHQEESSSELSAGAGAGIMAAVMILIVTVIAVAVVIWLRRRDWILPCNPSRNHTSPSKRESVSSIPQHQPGHQPSCGLADQSSLEGHHALGQEEPELHNNYDELRLQEVGLRSVYSEISTYRNTGARGDNPEMGPVYENNDSTQTSPYSNAHTA